MDLRFPLIRHVVAGIFFPALLAVVSFSQQPPPINPEQLVRDASYNELHPPPNNQRFLYKDTSTSKKGSVTKETIQTPQGPLSRTIAIDGKPLTPDQRAKEDARLKKFANDAAARSKRQQSDKEEGQREDLMVKTLPDAFLYTYEGTSTGPGGDELVHLKFKPNPNFSPPNHETQVYLGMQGDMYIDARVKRIAKIDGTLFKDVDFGWGILGRLDKGGKFVIDEADIGDGVWDTVRENLRFTGKVLLIKPLDIESVETKSDFRPVSSQLTTAQALDLLQKADETVAENGTAPGQHR